MVGDCMRCKLHNSRKVKCDKLESKEVNSEDSESEDEGVCTNTCCLRRLLSMQEDFQGQKCLIQLVCSESVPHSSPFLHIFYSLPMVRLSRKAAMKVMSSTSSPSSILSSTLWNTCGVGQSVTFRSAPMGSSPLQRVWCQLLSMHVPWSPSDASFVI